MVLELPIQVPAVPRDTSPPGLIIRGTFASQLGWDCCKRPHGDPVARVTQSPRPVTGQCAGG